MSQQRRLIWLAVVGGALLLVLLVASVFLQIFGRGAF